MKNRSRNKRGADITLQVTSATGAASPQSQPTALVKHWASPTQSLSTDFFVILTYLLYTYIKKAPQWLLIIVCTCSCQHKAAETCMLPVVGAPMQLPTDTIQEAVCIQPTWLDRKGRERTLMSAWDQQSIWIRKSLSGEAFHVLLLTFWVNNLGI